MTDVTTPAPRVAPKDYIVCKQPNGFDAMIRVSAITAVYTNAEERTGIQTQGGHVWIINEDVNDVLAKIAAATPSATPSATTEPVSAKTLPLPPDDMRDGDLPKEPV